MIHFKIKSISTKQIYTLQLITVANRKESSVTKVYISYQFKTSEEKSKPWVSRGETDIQCFCLS